MTLDEARAWLATLPFKDVDTTVRYDADGRNPNGSACDPHAYVILGWRETDPSEFWQFVSLIRAKGYPGRYSPPYDLERVMTNTYLQIDDWIYWFIGPGMLNRQHRDHKQHERISKGEL